MNIEKNTALISIEEYDNLRQFKKEILAGAVIKVYSYYGLEDNFYIVSMNTNEAIEDISKENLRLSEACKILKKELDYTCDEKDTLKIKLEQAKKDTFWKWLTRK